MKTQKRLRDVARHDAPQESNNQLTTSPGQSSDQDRHPVAVTKLGEAYPPCRGRSLWAFVVHYSNCNGVHLHRGGPPRRDGHLRDAPCGTSYRIIAIPVQGRAVS
jgi:hypothetical protein